MNPDETDEACDAELDELVTELRQALGVPPDQAYATGNDAAQPSHPAASDAQSRQ